MSRLLCCVCLCPADMGAALSHAGTQDVEACDGAVLPAAPPTMADVIRERKKKAGGAALGTLRRRLAAAARRPRDARPDRGCEHARFIRSVVSSWRLAEVFLLCEELEAGAALRDLCTQAELARQPAPHLARDLHKAVTDRWWCDVELVGAGFSIPAHRAILSARCTYFRDLLQHYPRSVYRVPLEGAGASLSREDMEATIAALYTGEACSRRTRCSACDKYERSAEDDLDIINVEGSNSRRGRVCACASRAESGSLRRLAALLGFSLDSLHRDMRYLLDSGELADARLVFRLESGCGAQYGFRTALEQTCHRVVLAARSRFFRSVMSRRAMGAGAGSTSAVCVDEKVLPRRFARALLHAAYTDQVDLSLVGRNSSSPSSTTSSGSGTAPWAGVGRGRAANSTMLEDAFQLYEIARFVEMPIVVQGCEDAIVEALCPDTLPAVLRWAAQPHASQWVHRQASRYLRDEFPAIMAHSASARLPSAALSAALASPFLQASEPQALRAVVRWAERASAQHREPNVVWHTAHSVSRRGARRRDVSDAALRELLAPLVPLLRLEHLPSDYEPLQQLVRRGVIPPPPEPSSGMAAWLARGSYRPPRCFLPYLDELKALLEEQAVPEADLARARRAKNMHRIPDTLYMVAAARTNEGSGSSAGVGGVGCVGGAGGAESACVSPRTLWALGARVRELRAAPPAVRALQLHAQDTRKVQRQIALRAVREMSLPDSCAELLLNDDDVAPERESTSNRSRSSGEWEYDRDRRENREPREREGQGRGRRWEGDDDCCSSASASNHAASTGSLRYDSGSLPHRPLQIPLDVAAMAGRRPAPRAPDSSSACAGAAARLSLAVPDVAMAPNANTHLLTAPAYFRPHLPHLPPPEYSGGVLQLDLGDGATHTPRPGSRAARALAQHSRQRDGAVCGSRHTDTELRAAIDLSVIQAYGSLQCGSLQRAGRARGRPADGPPAHLADRAHVSHGPHAPHVSHVPHAAHAAALARAPSPSSLSAQLAARRTPTLTLGRSRSPSPARAALARHHYRPEAGYGSPAGGSRSHSPREHAQSVEVTIQTEKARTRSSQGPGNPFI